MSLGLTWTPRGHVALPAPPPLPPDPALGAHGTLRVKLRGAAELRAADLNGLSDPYAYNSIVIYYSSILVLYRSIVVMYSSAAG